MSPADKPLVWLGGAVKTPHELPINDGDHAWRLIYYVGRDAVVILDVFSKKTQTTPKGVIETCRKRLNRYQRASEPRG